MFGLFKNCNVDKVYKAEWMSHTCGLCASLSRNVGSISRIFTNSDAVLVSLLYGAQCEQVIEESFHSCFLRRNRRMAIISPDSICSKYAAIISSLIASSKIIDKVVDGDSWMRHFPGRFSRIGANLNRKAARLALEINMDTRGISEQVFRQIKVEQEKGLDFLVYSQPTETATSLACSTTAELTRNPQNRGPLAVVGRMYGRIIYLLDSFRDYQTDLMNKSFNPFIQSLNGTSLKRKAEEVFHAAYGELKDSLRKVEFVHPEPCLTLLGNNLGVLASGILDGASPDDESPEGNRGRGSWTDWCCCNDFSCCGDCGFCDCGGDGCCGGCDCGS